MQDVLLSAVLKGTVEEARAHCRRVLDDDLRRRIIPAASCEWHPKVK